MKVFLSGAFGNVGKSTIDELVKQGHIVRCFDVPTRKNKKVADRAMKRYGDRVEVVWGDLRRVDDLAAAVRDQDVVVHLAFIIPKMSATGIESEREPTWAREINVGGTQNLLQAIKAQPVPPKILFTSSYHVYGRTQDQPPPRTVLDPVHPIEHYSKHKVECERMVQGSGLTWVIFRLSAALPFAIQLDPGMFDVPLCNRMEYVHSRDVSLAIANAIVSDNVWGRLLLIGGGLRCQYTYREIVERILGAVGVGMLPDEAFGTTPFCTDWVDTTVSQQLLSYQQRDLGDYIEEMKIALGFRRALVKVFRPLVRWQLLRKSPYYERAKAGGVAAALDKVRQIAPQAQIELTPELRLLLTETAKDLKGKARLLFMARAVIALGQDGLQKAEQELGWARNMIMLGMRELERQAV
ncbi:MAG: NAD(P)-dependent oxidoreductase [Anaerolineae bacterium]|nr:NAD(P)-dependent oxidoreductase [Anaerolineae bacterium]